MLFLQSGKKGNKELCPSAHPDAEKIVRYRVFLSRPEGLRVCNGDRQHIAAKPVGKLSDDPR